MQQPASSTSATAARASTLGSLVAINSLIPWESFRSKPRAALEQAGQRKTADARQSAAGRKPLDEVPMVKMLELQSLCNLADEAVEYQVRDRLSFMRVLDLARTTRCPTPRRSGSIARRRPPPG